MSKGRMSPQLVTVRSFALFPGGINTSWLLVIRGQRLDHKSHLLVHHLHAIQWSLRPLQTPETFECYWKPLLTPELTKPIQILTRQECSFWCSVICAWQGQAARNGAQSGTLSKQHPPGSLTNWAPGNELPPFSSAFAEEGGGGWGRRKAMREHGRLLHAWLISVCWPWSYRCIFTLRLNFTILMFCLGCTTQASDLHLQVSKST